MHDLLLSRRTVNDFEVELPQGWEAKVRRAVEAAISAPNHKRTEPWRFHLLGPQAIRRVCELNADIVTATKGAAAGAKKLERWLAMPGWLVATCVRSAGRGRTALASMDEPASVAREDYAACCCAVHNLCLSMHADGLGTKWTTGAVNFDERFHAAAGLPSAVPVLPLPDVARTLIVADTSSLHCRGLAEAGSTRMALRPMGAENDGGVQRQNPFRPVVA